MTRTIPTTAVFVLALTAAATVAMAAPGGDRAGFRGAPEFSELDANGDGVLTQEDLTAAAQARFSDVDADGNGSVTRAEMAAHAESQREERRQERLDDMIERADANNDGALSFEELTDERRGTRMLDRLDADGNGEVSEEEFASFERRGPKHRHGGSNR